MSKWNEETWRRKVRMFKMKRGKRTKPRKQPPPPPKNLAADRTGVPNAPNILKGDALWMRDGSVLPRRFVEEMLRLRGRKL